MPATTKSDLIFHCMYNITELHHANREYSKPTSKLVFDHCVSLLQEDTTSTTGFLLIVPYKIVCTYSIVYNMWKPWEGLKQPSFISMNKKIRFNQQQHLGLMVNLQNVVQKDIKQLWAWLSSYNNKEHRCDVSIYVVYKSIQKIKIYCMYVTYNIYLFLKSI